MERLAVFDLDGTLVDSVPDIHAALDRLLAARGLARLARQEVVGMIGDGARVLVTRALAARGAEADDDAHAAFLGDYEAHATLATRPFPGIPEALDALESQGWRLAVCTNKPALATETLLSGLGLRHRFAAVGAGDSFPMRKPDPGHLRATIAAAGGSLENSVMIGDHRNDVAAALGAGVPCVFAAWGYGTLAMAEGAAVATSPARLPAEIGAALERLRA